MLTTRRNDELNRIHFHGMLDIPCGLLLLQASVVRLSGLPGPPDDSLRVPRDGGLLAPVGPLHGASLGCANRGSIWCLDFDSLRPSVLKLPTMTCNRNGKPIDKCSSLIYDI